MPSYDFPDVRGSGAVDTKFYWLEPDKPAYDAAIALIDIVDENRRQATPATTASLTAFNQAQFDALQDQKQLLKPIGLLWPAVQILALEEASPRAYQHYPLVYVDRTLGKNRPDLYMYSPVDYKGQHFKAADSSEVIGREIDTMFSRLMTADDAEARVVLERPRYGIATPSDFDRNKHFSHQDDVPGQVARAFIVEGRSLELVDQFREAHRQHKSGRVPALTDYPELRGNLMLTRRGVPERANPYLSELAGRTIIVYPSDVAQQSSFRPPDSVPLSTAVYQWVTGDHADAVDGIVSPPMPATIRAQLNKGFEGTVLQPRPSTGTPKP